jgi:hypothetical protein
MDAIQVVRLALTVISERLLVIFAMSMNFGLACWTMWGLGWERLVALTVFAVFSFALINKESKERSKVGE